MNFKKDILLIDLEFSGLNPEKHEILQLAAVLLDKKTLKEKSFFNSYIRPSPSLWRHRDPESMKVNKISEAVLKNASPLKQVIKEFDKQFGSNVILAAYVGFNDKRFLVKAYEKTKVKFDFDYHFFDLWALFYSYLAKKNLLKSQKDFAGFGMESLIKMLKLKVDESKLHDALVDCRTEAEVLRRIIKKI